MLLSHFRYTIIVHYSVAVKTFKLRLHSQQTGKTASHYSTLLLPSKAEPLSTLEGDKDTEDVVGWSFPLSSITWVDCGSGGGGNSSAVWVDGSDTSGRAESPGGW